MFQASLQLFKITRNFDLRQYAWIEISSFYPSLGLSLLRVVHLISSHTLVGVNLSGIPTAIQSTTKLLSKRVCSDRNSIFLHFLRALFHKGGFSNFVPYLWSVSNLQASLQLFKATRYFDPSECTLIKTCIITM